jgi:hypothetical protein
MAVTASGGGEGGQGRSRKEQAAARYNCKEKD